MKMAFYFLSAGSVLFPTIHGTPQYFPGDWGASTDVCFYLNQQAIKDGAKDCYKFPYNPGKQCESQTTLVPNFLYCFLRLKTQHNNIPSS